MKEKEKVGGRNALSVNFVVFHFYASDKEASSAPRYCEEAGDPEADCKEHRQENGEARRPQGERNAPSGDSCGSEKDGCPKNSRQENGETSYPHRCEAAGEARREKDGQAHRSPSVAVPIPSMKKRLPQQ